METPRVTLVTPSFNQADFLEQTLRSVLDQGYPNLEYIVVDGGSSDGSVEIIRRYSDKLAWWVSEKDSGQAEAINKGFARATGEYIAWLNSDDLHQPGAISAAVEALRQQPDSGFVYGDVLSIDASGKPINLMKFAPYSLADLMAFRIISQPGVMLRREVLEKAGFLETGYHYLLDHQLWLRIARLSSIVYLPRIQASARFHPSAKNVAQAPHFGQEALKIAAWLEASPEFQPHYRRNRVWGGAYRVNGWYLVEGGQPGPGLRSYFRSLRYNPSIVLADWQRIAYACLALIGLSRLKATYYRLRGAFRRRTHPEIYGSGPGAR